MAVERARAHILPKPWGVADLKPWSDARHDSPAIGEIWYERSDEAATESSLLLKLLFTNQPLSIQVHPDDVFARSVGLPRGKTEAWYILSAAPGAKVALGLKERVSQQQLREAVDDGSIAGLVVWRPVSAGDVIFVPAGTIHAIGAGLVIAELQQRSDATFRLHDHGRQRELHVENAIAVANAGPADFLTESERLTAERTLLVSSPLFSLEKIDLPPSSAWRLSADRETWLLVLGGDARIGAFDVVTGGAVFAELDRVDIRAGAAGLVCLLAYTGPVPDLLRDVEQPDAREASQSHAASLTTSLVRTNTTATDGSMEAMR